MSRKQLRLEGNSVEEVLKQVEAQYGSTVRVVSADKERTGGLGGFFAREFVVLTVEVDDHLEPTTTASDTTLRASSHVVGESAATGIEALLAAAENDSDFDTVEFRHASAQSAIPQMPDAPSQPSVASHPAVQPRTADPSRPEIKPVTWTRVEPTAHNDPSSFSALKFDSLSDEHLDATPTVLMPNDPSPHQPVTPLERGFDDVLKAAQALVEDVAAREDILPPSRRKPVTTRTDGATLMELRAIGLPPELLARLPADHNRYTLSEVLSHVYHPPHTWTDAGTLTVVLGVGANSYDVACQFAKGMSVPDERVIAAGAHTAKHHPENSITTAQHARKLKTSARETLQSMVAFVDVGPSQSDWYVAGRLLAAFDADYVHAVIDADADLAHVRRCLDDVTLGKPIHSLAVQGAVGSKAPGRILSLGIPVSLIDGFPATAVTWAAAISAALPAITWD